MHLTETRPWPDRDKDRDKDRDIYFNRRIVEPKQRTEEWRIIQVPGRHRDYMVKEAPARASDPSDAIRLIN
jgi:hypothetical protein